MPGTVTPVYYPLEAITNYESCQNFYQKEKDQSTGVAADDRYTNSIEDDIAPTEYTFQSNSGVLDTLESMPSFYTYIPDPDPLKASIQYQFWERTVLEYDEEGCGLPIADAIDEL